MSVPRLMSYKYKYKNSLSLCDWLCFFRADQRQRCRLDARLHVEPDQHDSSRGCRLPTTVPRRLRLHRDTHGNSALCPTGRQPALPLFPPLQGAADRVSRKLPQRGRSEAVTIMLHGRLAVQVGQSSLPAALASAASGDTRTFSEGHIPTQQVGVLLLWLRQDSVCLFVCVFVCRF